MSRRADSEMVKEMLEKAAPRLTDKGTMLHSDQGVLYRTESDIHKFCIFILNKKTTSNKDIQGSV